MRRKEIVFVLFASILLLSFFSFVSAGMLSNTFRKTQITGETIESACSDSDSGKDYFTKGTIVGGGVSFVQYDYCLTLTSTGQIDSVSCEASNPDCRLHEFYCEDGIRKGVRVSCDYGCSNGVCNPAQVQEQSCTDTDGGENIFVKGTVNSIYQDGCYIGGSYGRVDFCSGSNCTVMENFCGDSDGQEPFENTTALVREIPCPYGCSNGACFSEPTPLCSETDGGINYYVKGENTDYRGTTPDECFNSLSLHELFCKDGKYEVDKYTCPNGCSNGACVQESLCSSQVTMNITKGGNYLVQANTTFNANLISGKVREISWALQGDTEPKVSLNANNAQACSLHAGEDCTFYYGPVTHPISKNLRIFVNSIKINEESPGNTTACITITEINQSISYTDTIYPAPFVVNGLADVAIIYGTQTGISNLELVQANNLQTDLQERSTGTGELLVKDSERTSVLDKNLIVIGTPCSNSAIPFYLRLSDCNSVTSNLQLAPGKAALKPVTGENGKLVLLVVGYSPEELTKIVTYLTTKEIMTSRAYLLTVLEANQTVYIGDNCTDTDQGIDYYIKGTATYDSETYSDKCSSDNITVQELYCKQDGIYAQQYLCPNGCKNGACVKESDVCAKYYTCPDGTKVNYCSMVSTENSAACKCAINPSSLCSNTNNTSNTNISEIPTTLTCERYYTCQDGSQVQYCFMQKMYAKNGEVSGAGCGCKSNPEMLCSLDNFLLENTNSKPVSLETQGENYFATNETPIFCNGCIIGNKCAPVGYRTKGKYCALEGELASQVSGEQACENNFECKSNLCIDDQCVNQGAFTRMMNWFKNSLVKKK